MVPEGNPQLSAFAASISASAAVSSVNASPEGALLSPSDLLSEAGFSSLFSGAFDSSLLAASVFVSVAAFASVNVVEFAVVLLQQAVNDSSIDDASSIANVFFIVFLLYRRRFRLDFDLQTGM